MTFERDGGELGAELFFASLMPPPEPRDTSHKRNFRP